MAAQILTFHLRGPIVPYVRMTRNSIFTDRSKRYLDSQEHIRRQYQRQMDANGWQKLPECSLSVEAHFYVEKEMFRRKDADNCLKAVLDAANTQREKHGKYTLIIWPGVIPDDRFIDHIIVTKRAEYDPELVGATVIFRRLE